MKRTTSIAVEFHMCFDNDFDVYTISDTLDLPCDECKNRNETRINPITDEHNCGYWSIKAKLHTLVLENVTSILLNKIQPKLQIMKQILVENSGSLMIDIIPIIEDNITPSLSFNREFLSIVEELHAEIDIDMYIN